MRTESIFAAMTAFCSALLITAASPPHPPPRSTGLEAVLWINEGENDQWTSPDSYPGSPEVANRFRTTLTRLSNEELFGHQHSLSQGSGVILQERIDNRLANRETSPCFTQSRLLLLMIMLRECQLEELAWRDYHRNWTEGHSTILGPGFSKQFDSDLYKIREQRAKFHNSPYQLAHY